MGRGGRFRCGVVEGKERGRRAGRRPRQVGGGFYNKPMSITCLCFRIIIV